MKKKTVLQIGWNGLSVQLFQTEEDEALDTSLNTEDSVAKVSKLTELGTLIFSIVKNDSIL